MVEFLLRMVSRGIEDAGVVVDLTFWCSLNPRTKERRCENRELR